MDLSRIRFSILILGAAMLCGCQMLSWQKALFWDKMGKPLKAVENYESFLEAYPRQRRAAEAHVRAADIYAGLGRCIEARRHYESAARDFPEQQSWSARAKSGIMSCPDYFPLEPGYSWVYGDSASLGRNMRLEARVELRSSRDRSRVDESLYAGKKIVRQRQIHYEKRDWAVWESDGGKAVMILRYPFREGQSWTSAREGRELQFRIESEQAEARTAAGVFPGCLKVRESNPQFKGSWKYDYYAPGVGRVKTTVAGPGFENPNAELLEFQSPLTR
ncbi:MAG: tetratricopeptide repeat protein [Elusimicrobia bacterium]|nr:tetratricopeptide repeat protein [Elusimicrobiota bacterium]